MANTQFILIGSYTQSIGAMTGEGKGISVVELNTETGKLLNLELLSDSPNPAYLTLADERLFSINEFASGEGAGITVFERIDEHLTLTDHLAIQGDYPCHVAMNSDGSRVIASNYGSGNFSLFSHNEGKIELIHTIQHHGTGPNAERQEGPHAHFACFLNHTAELVTVDLGIDRVSFYPLTPSGIDESNAQHVSTPPGSGPRHLVLTKDEKTAYVLCELSEEVLVLKKEETDQWSLVSKIAPFTPHDEGGAAAAIRLSPDEKFVYVSGRQQSVIVCLKVESDASLTTVQTVSSGGLNPRDFNITADGKWLISANQDTNNVISYRRNAESGELEATGYSISTGNPVCITF
ncbi:6-phosphogluconolactonase [Vibrio nigripulchritudo ATCC 27043]|uniref:lactonase family protein n=1 Tax=Vibrio nigripulchritudo TaxID=28173 RepID=UPI00021C1B90|nr:lactonase family protein [Vibrio nigripulchritudo]EGU60507.1 6-phosphogluconolactonase [Vibrio nigripulchritudo ATCC 27043]